jgi:hypothetical protein
VLENEEDIRALTMRFADEIRTGKVKGLRSFDRKLYFISTDFAKEWGGKAVAALTQKEKSAEEIAAEIGLAPEACRGLLFHLSESEESEILEKRKGKYSKA